MSFSNWEATNCKHFSENHTIIMTDITNGNPKAFSQLPKSDKHYSSAP